MAFDLKSATPDTTFPSGGFLFGADSQSASNPSAYSDTAYRDYLVGLANTWTANGAASTPSQLLNGTWFTGGSATTTKPQFLIEPSGTTSNNWSTSGTGLGINAGGSFSGNLLDIQLSASLRLLLTSAGALTIAGSYITNNNMEVGNGWWQANGAAGASGGVFFGSGHLITWGSAATFGGGAADSGISRSGAGIIEVNNGTAGTFRDLKSRSLITPMTSELTIATGVITVTGSYHNVDTEADAASDDLDTINGGVDGMEVVLRANNDGRTVVVKDATGNLQIAGDMTLDNTQDTITLIYDGTLTAWLEKGRAASGA